MATSIRTAWPSLAKARGELHRGNILVSNFNNSANQQGTGSTIVQITPRGHVSLFAQISSRGLPGACPGGIGLSTALVIMNGWVIVGSTPSRNGDPATAKAGCLLVLDSQGRVRETFAGHGINGPWDATVGQPGLDRLAVRHQRAERHGRRGRQRREPGHGAADRAQVPVPANCRR